MYHESRRFLGRTYYRDTPVLFEHLEHEKTLQVTCIRQQLFALSVLKT